MGALDVLFFLVTGRFAFCERLAALWVVFTNPIRPFHGTRDTPPPMDGFTV